MSIWYVQMNDLCLSADAIVFQFGALVVTVPFRPSPWVFRETCVCLGETPFQLGALVVIIPFLPSPVRPILQSQRNHLALSGPDRSGRSGTGPGQHPQP